MRAYDTAIIGGGIVGLATAMARLQHRPGPLVVVEAEERLAAHQSGRNSGVVHSGLYYRPGSLKARLCAEGREALYRFCRDRGVPCERCGKVVVAAAPAEVPCLEALLERGLANGLTGIRRLSPGELREREPHAAGIEALLVPDTGITDFAAVAERYADVVREGGGEILTGARVAGVRRDGGTFVIQAARGEIRCRVLVNCAGLQADRVARMCGARPDARIIPFRGEYWSLASDRRDLVRHLIYPVPDPRLPFLGAHLSRRIDGSVHAGPGAVLALDRHGYRRGRPRAADVADMLGYPGFWRMAARHWPAGLTQLRQSLSRRALVRALQRLVPELEAGDLRRAHAGVRAQAVDRRGVLIDDFRIVKGEGMVHVLNAPSPAATASISIGRHIAAEAADL